MISRLMPGVSLRWCAAARAILLRLAIVASSLGVSTFCATYAQADEPPPALAEPFTLEDPPRIVPSPIPRIWLAEFSPDGKLIATTAGWHAPSTPFRADGVVENGELVLWDVAKREPRAAFFENNTVRAAAFSLDGKLLAYCLYDGKVKLVDLATDKVVKTLGGHKALANALCFSPDGKTIVSCGFDQTLRFWDVKNRKALKELRTECARITDVTFSRDGKKLATGDWEAPFAAQVWDVEAGKVVQTLTHKRPVEAVSFSPDGEKLATASWDGHLRVWDVAKGEELMDKEHGNNGAMFSPDGKLIAACGYDQIAVHGFPGGDERWTLRGQGRSVRFSPDGKTLAAAFRHNVVKLYEAATGKEITELTRNTDPDDEPQAVRAVAFSSDGKTVASAGDAKQVRLHDASTGLLQGTLKDFKEAVTSLAFAPESGWLAIGTADGTAKLWDVKVAGKPTVKLALPAVKGAVAAVAFSPDGKMLALAGDDKSIHLFLVADGKELAALTGHEGAVRAIAFSSDGKRLASGSDDTTIKLWNVETKTKIVTLEGHTAGVRSVAFAPDGKLVSGGADGKVRFWDADGAARGSVAAHAEGVGAVAFVGRDTAISAGADGKLILWDAQKREQRQTLAAHSGPVTSLVIAADGRRVATGSLDKSVRIWPIRNIRL